VQPRVVQLYSRREPPPWWTQALAACSVRGLVAAEIQPDAKVVIIPRSEWPDLGIPEIATKVVILVDSGWTPQSLKRALHALKGALFYDSRHPVAELGQILTIALARSHEREQQSELMQILRKQNREIDELNRGLEDMVKERTVGEAETRRASQKNVLRMREIIGFIKELSQIYDVEELLPLIRRQTKSFHQLGWPLLFIPRGEDFGDLYHMRSLETIRTRVRGLWTPSARLRIQDPEDSRFLANAMGRPVSKVIRFPLPTSRSQNDLSRAPLLMFECAVPSADLSDTVNQLSEKLQPVSWALDRLILEQELKNTAQEWENTFDELDEPIAILAQEGQVMRANAQWSAEVEAQVKEGHERIRSGDRWYVVERFPIEVDSGGPPVNWVVYLRDETRSRKLKTEVLQMEKMSALGQLAGHLAHELNNPLTGIRSLAQVLIEETEPTTQVHKDLKEVEEASARCQGIINNLLEFAKGDLEHKSIVADLNEVTRKTLPLLKSVIGKYRSDIELCPDPLRVRVEPQMMQQVIFNLINNACQAMSARGEISVRSLCRPPWAFLEVKDSGPGIDENLRERVFEPFFTTKAEGEGTGLGLSLSRDFVRQFGGEIELESEVGRGSLFRVRLPLSEDTTS